MIFFSSIFVAKFKYIFFRLLHQLKMNAKLSLTVLLIAAITFNCEAKLSAGGVKGKAKAPSPYRFIPKPLKAEQMPEQSKTQQKIEQTPVPAKSEQKIEQDPIKEEQKPLTKAPKPILQKPLEQKPLVQTPELKPLLQMSTKDEQQPIAQMPLKIEQKPILQMPQKPEQTPLSQQQQII